MSDKAAALSDLLSVPKGGGAIQGLGEKFSADLHTGTGNFSVPIGLPAGRNGLQPKLMLAFTTGAGNGAFGLGWSISVPGVSRLTSKGVPRYLAGIDADIFVLSGAEDLIQVAAGGAVTNYQPRTEGLFAQITHHTGDTDHWEMRTKDGLQSIYGSPGISVPVAAADDSRAVVSDPDNRAKVFAWRLTETRDLFGNRVVYDYVRDLDTTRGRNGEQLYLRRIRYVDLDGAADQPFLISAEFVYDSDAPNIAPEVSVQTRPDPFSDFRAGFEIRTRKRCKAIVVRTHPAAGQDVLVRAYELIYRDEQTADPAALPPNGISLLSRINVIGYDDLGRGHREMPPLDFEYSAFIPAGRRFVALQGRSLPATSLTNPDLELVDLFGRGLPDIVELGGTARYWRNLGNGHFDLPRPFSDIPAGCKLSEPGVQLLDANGDGRADLLVTTPEQSGYYPMDFRGGFDRRSYQRFDQAPSFNFEDPEVRLIDLTGDGVTDVLRSGTTFECYFNHPTQGWTPRRTARIARKRLEEFPDVSFSDPRVKFADLSGDGLQDIAYVTQGRIDYWPQLGWGRWAGRRMMAVPEGLPFDFDPQRVLLGDVDGDGLADLLYVSDREVTLWINRCGNGWSDPITIRGTPAVNSMVSVRLTDLMGTGVPGLLWTRDAMSAGDARHFFLDFTGGRKPYLLTRIDNNLGAVTEVRYASSTRFCLRDDASPATRWHSTLPFPVQVVERVTVRDELSQGSMTTEYRYHHGYWDGLEREFRGFGMVEQLDTEVFEAYAGRSLSARDDVLRRLLRLQSFSPPLLTRTWFHQGPVQPADSGHWQELDARQEYWSGDVQLLDHKAGIDAFIASLPAEAKRDALRALRGSVLRTELFALDGSALQERPYTVTEAAYALREESAISDAGLQRKRIFFPHMVGQRTTQWERGDDPLTQFSLTDTADYDAWGQATRSLSVACPRGWRTLADRPDAEYLATQATTAYAQLPAGALFPRDRVSCSRSHELVESAGLTVGMLRERAANGTGLRLFAETLNYYDGEAHTGLPLGQLGAVGVLVRAESLVLTEEIVKSAYGTQPPAILVPNGIPGSEYPTDFVTRLPALCGYHFKEGRGADVLASRGWFARTASSRFDFQSSPSSLPARGLLLSQRDSFGNESFVSDYLFQLLPTGVTGPTGMTTLADYDLRLLQPWRVTDPNGNVTEVRYSPSGLVTDTFLRGKPDAAAGDSRNAGDRELPSIHVEYGLRAFHDSKLDDPSHLQPVYARAVRRVFHDSDLDRLEASDPAIESREYSDGFGRVLQTRTQGEEVRFGDERYGNAVVSLDQGDPASRDPVVGRLNDDPGEPNVTVSGWQRYDNKGRVIEKFEPFFARGWHWTELPADERGASVRISYDARGHAFRTVNPDGSMQIALQGIPVDLADPPHDPLDTAKYRPTPWQAYTYDGNDNAGRTHVGQEPHVRYPHHHDTPASVEVDALGRTVRAVARHRAPPDANGRLPPIEEHVTRTRYDIQGNVTGIRDTLGRLAFEYVLDLAKRPLHTRSIDAGPKWTVFDAAGNGLENCDAKGALSLQSHDALSRPVRLWARDAANDVVTLREVLRYGDEPEYAATAAEHNQLGRPIDHHDEAGVVHVAGYDFKGNVLESSRQVLTDDFLLGPYRAEIAKPEAERSWVLSAPRVDWSAAQQVESLLGPAYATRSAFDALNRVKWSDHPRAANGERYRLRPRYNRAGALEGVSLVGPLDANDQGASQVYVQRIAYNAKGQRSLIAYGNGITTRYAYEPTTFRLARMRTERHTLDDSDPLRYVFSGAPLQDLAYSYDLAGNILGIQDTTPGSGVVDNADAIFYDGDLALRLSRGDALIRCFEYDPLYRLMSATGREAVNIASPRPWLDLPRDGYNSGAQGTPNQDNAPNLTALYCEEYTYDPAGNMLTIHHSRHVGGSNGGGWQTAWSRRFGMHGRTPDVWRYEAARHLTGEWDDAPSNRLTHVEDRPSGGPRSPSIPQSHWYDANGNMVREHNERHFEWDHGDRMKAFRNQTNTSRPTTYALYLYDASGMRVKKLVVDGGNGYRTTTYLGNAFEHHAEQKLDGSDKAENCTLQVMDGKSQIAIVRVGPAFEDDGAKEHPLHYHLADHLGSTVAVVSGSRDWINKEEFFPYGETSFGSFGRKRYRFTGSQRDDETGLNVHATRYYNLGIARWVSCDASGASDDSNLFSYVGGNPCVRVDPSGLAGESSQLELIQQSGLRQPVTATATGPGFGQSLQQIFQALGNQWQLGSTDVGHPEDQPFSLTPAGTTTSVYAQPRGENRSLGASLDKAQVAAARSSGQFARQSGVDQTAVKGTRYGQPARVPALVDVRVNDPQSPQQISMEHLFDIREKVSTSQEQLTLDFQPKSPALTGLTSMVSTGAAQVGKSMVPLAEELETSLMAIGQTARNYGLGTIATVATTAAEAVPIAAASGTAGALCGRQYEEAAISLGASKADAVQAGMWGAFATGVAVGAAVGAPTLIGAPVGAFMGGLIGAGTYLWTR